MILCNPVLNPVKVNLHTKYQGRRSNRSSRRAQTSKRTNGRTDATKYIISLASRSIIKEFSKVPLLPDVMLCISLHTCSCSCTHELPISILQYWHLYDCLWLLPLVRNWCFCSSTFCFLNSGQTCPCISLQYPQEDIFSSDGPCFRFLLVHDPSWFLSLSEKKKLWQNWHWI